MNAPHLKLVDDSQAEEVSADPAAVQAVAAWVNQLGRAIKTCRLYDGANPIVVRFREELAGALGVLLARYGALPLKVSSNALAFAGQEVHAAQSREDNLAGVFHRDGIRLVTLEPGMDLREVDLLLDQLLHVTGPAAADDDLVTLLWDANLPHLVLETVPLEGEADGGGESDPERPDALAFPRQERGAAAPPAETDGEQVSDLSRSEDWTTGESVALIEQVVAPLQAAADAETSRFQREYESAAEESAVTATLRVLQDCFANELSATDRKEVLDFIPRVLREALALGDWRGASLCLQLLRNCEPSWSVEAFSLGLCGPFAITNRRVVSALDRQDPKEVEAFLGLAREFGPAIGEWLMHILAGSEQMRVRRPLARAIAELLDAQPETLAPWSKDERWYVVRNVVHILGWIGGDRIVTMLQAVAEHPEPRVRREVVAALSEVDHPRARPILVKMLRSAEPKLFGAILHQLATDPHHSIAEFLLGLFRADGFAARGEDERRAVFLALATRGDEVVPALESALNEGGFFSRGPEPDRPAIALCLARIGSPAAKAILEKGLRSKRGPVRKACLIAGATGASKHE